MAGETNEQAQEQERTYTQAEVDDIVKKRVDRLNRKYEGFEDYKAKAEQFDARADYDDVVKERDQLKAAVARRDLLDSVSAKTGVPAALLKGADEAELTASAEAIAEYVRKQVPAYPEDKGGGANPSHKKTPAELFAEAINGQLS